MFHPIDLKSWPRAQSYWYFSHMAPTGYSLTAEVDVTHLYETVKARGYKFFPAYLWLVTRNMNRQVEFKCAEKDGVLGYYDELTPFYATFHEDDHTISMMWTPFSKEFSVFHDHYLENQKVYGGVHGFLSQPSTPPPENAYTVSALPWVNFSHFSVHSYGNKPYYFPSVEAGQLVEKDGRKIMPLSLTLHHATTDGYHVSQFLKGLQEDMDHFEAYL